MRPVSLFGHNLYFAGVDSRRMLVEFGASCPARRRDHLRCLVQHGLDDVADAIRLLKRCAGWQVGVDVQGALIKGRQKLPPHQRAQKYSDQEHRC
jgi:hypothetical protein